MVLSRMLHIDPDSLTRSLAELAERAAPVSDEDLSASVQLVVERAASVFNVSGVGLMLIGADGELRYVASSAGTAREFELAQIEIGEGPCIDSFVLGNLVQSSDMHTDARWPRLSTMLAEAPIHAVLGVPTRINSETVGTLNAYSDEPHEWDASDVAALEAYGRVLEGLLTGALAARTSGRLVDQLQHALDRRVAIERSIGLVMGRDRVDAITAFNTLRTTARSERRRVADVAAELLGRWEA